MEPGEALQVQLTNSETFHRGIGIESQEEQEKGKQKNLDWAE